MDVFLNFLFRYWKLIAFIIVIILETVLLILKGKTKTVYFSNVADLCQYIREAEAKGFETGEGKLLYVIERYYAEHPDSSIETWMLKNDIERILSTPTKKGGAGREKD